MWNSKPSQLARRFCVVAALLASAVHCSAGRLGTDSDHTTLTFPVRFADGKAQGGAAGNVNHSDKGSGRAASATAGSSAGESGGEPNSGDLPDPPALLSSAHWELTLGYRRGEIQVVGARSLSTPTKEATRRFIGRFALELWSADTLVERIRFDFPLLASEAAHGALRPLKPLPEFAPGADVTRELRVPDAAEVDRATVVDRLTSKVVEVPWPPAPPLMK